MGDRMTTGNFGQTAIKTTLTTIVATAVREWGDSVLDGGRCDWSAWRNRCIKTLYRWTQFTMSVVGAISRTHTSLYCRGKFDRIALRTLGEVKVFPWDITLGTPTKQISIGSWKRCRAAECDPLIR